MPFTLHCYINSINKNRIYSSAIPYILVKHLYYALYLYKKAHKLNFKKTLLNYRVHVILFLLVKLYPKMPGISTFSCTWLNETNNDVIL